MGYFRYAHSGKMSFTIFALFKFFYSPTFYRKFFVHRNGSMTINPAEFCVLFLQRKNEKGKEKVFTARIKHFRSRGKQKGRTIYSCQNFHKGAWSECQWDIFYLFSGKNNKKKKILILEKKFMRYKLERIDVNAKKIFRKYEAKNATTFMPKRILKKKK